MTSIDGGPRSSGYPDFVGKTLAYSVVGETLILVHRSTKPANEEWEMYAEMVRSGKLTGVLVFAPPGCPGPDAAQRQFLIVAQREAINPVFTSLVTNSPLHRGIITALNWLARQPLRAYAPPDVGAAMEYAGVTPAAARHCMNALRRLATGLGELESFGALGLFNKDIDLAAS